MASTYEPIATYTVSGSSTNDFSFLSLPSTYTDIVCVVSGSSSADSRLWMRFNGDTGSNYSWTIIYGNGTNAYSGRSTTDAGAGFIATTQGNNVIHVMNYSNSTTYKTRLSRSNVANSTVESYVSLWRNTNAVTSITLQLEPSKYFTAGTTATLYGIKAA
jgi:hypothetical protein